MTEELREILAEGDPFSIGPGDGDPWTHLVGYEDVVAHEFEEGVERSVEAVAAVDGVVRVVHEDREVLLVEAPGVTPAALTAALRAFWRAETKRRPAWADAFEAVTAELAPVLKEAGFRRRKARWNRDADDGIVHVVELVHYDNGDGPHVLLELGVFEPVIAAQRFDWRRPQWVREHDCQLRVSSWTLGGGAGGSWPVGGGSQAVLDFLRGTALPFLDARASFAGLIDADASAAPGTCLQEVDRAIGLVTLGRREEAQVEIDAAFANFPRAHDHLCGVAEKLGLAVRERPAVDEPEAASVERPRRFGWLRRT